MPRARTRPSSSVFVLVDDATEQKVRDAVSVALLVMKCAVRSNAARTTPRGPPDPGRQAQAPPWR